LRHLPTNHQHWGQTTGAGSALAIAEGAQTSTTPLLVLVESTDAALTLKAELQFFLAATALQVYMLPDWEILPYDSFSAHPDIISERIKTLNAISDLQQGIILVPIATLLHRLAPY
jgi:transcription-repair coupling factor (superfamily II helicase)